MNIGDVVGMKTCKIVIQEGKGYLQYNAPKGKQFVFLLLGADNLKDGDKALDPNKILEAMGWKYMPDPKPVAPDENIGSVSALTPGELG